MSWPGYLINASENAAIIGAGDDWSPFCLQATTWINADHVHEVRQGHIQLIKVQYGFFPAREPGPRQTA